MMFHLFNFTVKISKRCLSNEELNREIKREQRTNDIREKHLELKEKQATNFIGMI